MFSLKAYKGKDIQNFLSLLVQFENEGITDTKIIQAEINKYVGASLIKTPINISKISQSKRYKKCPECGKGSLVPVRNADGLNIMGCSVCRYSYVIDSIKE